MNSVLNDRVGSFVGGKCFYDRDDETWSAVIFDWHALEEEFRRSFVGEIFGDCDDGDFDSILLDTDDGRKWRSKSPWLPFGLTNVQDDEFELALDDGFAVYPQFDNLLVVRVADLVEGGAIPVFAIEVDGTAIPAVDPEPFADSLASIGFRRE